MTVGIYARLSPKPNGKYEGVEDQVKWGTAYAERAWPGEPIEVFADRGLSGADGDREGYDRLQEWVAAGKLNHIWTVEQSRLMRGEIAWFQFNATLEASGITEVHTNRNGIIRVGDVTGGILAVVYANERRQMLRRLNDTLAEKAAKGEPPGVRPFGYKHAKMEDGKTRTYEVVPEQADVLRFAAEKVLAGWSLASIAADLDQRGVRGTHGGKVTAGSVTSWLTSPGIAGQRVHSGEIVGKGNWEPILDLSTFRAVGARLNGPRKVRRADGGFYPIGEAHRGSPGRRYLLTGGLAVCEVCQKPLVGTMKQLRNAQGVRSKPYFICHPRNGGRGCMGIMLPETEEHVVKEMFDYLDSPEFLDRVAAGDDHEQERARLVTVLSDIEAQRQELAGMWGRRELTTAEWQAAKDALAKEEHQANADLAVIPATSARVDIQEVREGWTEATLDEKREFIRRHVAKVTIHRATKHGRPGLDTDRIEIAWTSDVA